MCRTRHAHSIHADARAAAAAAAACTLFPFVNGLDKTAFLGVFFSTYYNQDNRHPKRTTQGEGWRLPTRNTIMGYRCRLSTQSTLGYDGM